MCEESQSSKACKAAGIKKNDEWFPFRPAQFDRVIV